MQHIPGPHEIYRHFKGNLYQIVTLAEHSETGEQLVIYQALYGEFKTYARPLSMFMEKVDKIKYPNATQEYRFEAVKTMTGMNAQPKVSVQPEMSVQPEVNAQPEANIQTKVAVGAQADGESEEEGEILNLDPLVIEFLDASTYEERLNILAGLHHRITDDMINVMAMATDIEVKPGDVEERYIELRNCLLTLEKFECNRLR